MVDKKSPNKKNVQNTMATTRYGEYNDNTEVLNYKQGKMGD
jgi:hypothetical protein